MKIDLMIIGAQKAGTTSLKNYLGEHPGIMTHAPIEFSYFRDTDEYCQGFERALKQSYGNVSGDTKLVAKNAGMYYEYEAIKRLKEHNPECKIVFLLREPVARLISAYKMEKFNGWLKYDFEDFVKVSMNNDEEHLIYRIFLSLGEYAKHLNEITKHFPISQIKLIEYNKLKTDAQGVCKEVFEWMDLPSKFEPNTEKRHNVSKQAKSKTATAFITWLRSENNYAKKIAKKMLPGKVFSSIGNKIIESNKSNESLNVEISEEHRNILIQHYRNLNYDLTEKYGFDTSHWLS